MIRGVVILFLSLLLGINAFGQSKKLIRTYSIESKTETTVKYDNGEETKRYVSETEKYNEDGERIEFVDYNSKGEIKSQEHFVYVKGRLVEEIKDKRIAKGAGKTSFEKSTYQYVKDKVVMKETFDADGNLKKRTTYSYNKFGDLELELKMDSDGQVKKQIQYEYDNRGLKIKKTITNAAGVVLEEKHYKYE